MGRPRILLIIALLARWTGTASAATPEYETAKKAAFTKKYCCFQIADSPETAKALNEVWNIVGEQTASFLAAHPSSIDLKADFKAFDPDLVVDTVALTPTLTLLTARNGEIGMAWLIERSGAGYKVTWTPGHLDDGTKQKFPALGAWEAINADDHCRQRRPQRSWLGCGPLFAKGAPLPPDKKGNLRFYLDGEYSQGAGATVGGQISIWLRRGDIVTPVLVQDYAFMIDQSIVTRLKGDLLMVREKDEYRAFYAAGSGLGRQMDQIYRLGPDDVTDLGNHAVVPEMDAIDELVTRILHHQPVGSLASGYAIEKLRGTIAQAEELAREISMPDFKTLGMLMQAVVQRHGIRITVCLETDGDGPPLLFDLKKTEKNGFFISSVAKVSEKSQFCSAENTP